MELTSCNSVCTLVGGRNCSLDMISYDMCLVLWLQLDHNTHRVRHSHIYSTSYGLVELHEKQTCAVMKIVASQFAPFLLNPIPTRPLIPGRL